MMRGDSALNVFIACIVGSVSPSGVPAILQVHQLCELVDNGILGLIRNNSTGVRSTGTSSASGTRGVRPLATGYHLPKVPLTELLFGFEVMNGGGLIAAEGIAFVVALAEQIVPRHDQLNSGSSKRSKKGVCSLWKFRGRENAGKERGCRQPYEPPVQVRVVRGLGATRPARFASAPSDTIFFHPCPLRRGKSVQLNARQESHR